MGTNTGGQCREPGFCAFPDPDCVMSGMRWHSSAGRGFAELCLGQEGAVPGGGANACGGTRVLTGVPGESCGPCGSGTWECAGPEELRCSDALAAEQDVTHEGTVAASTTFVDATQSYPASLAVDDKNDTSWFSSGPENGGSPSTFMWMAQRSDCVTNIRVTPNDGHAVERFRTGFGFNSITARVLSETGQVVYSEIRAVPGPDELVRYEPNVVGSKIELLLDGHEADDCGGFAELEVSVVRPLGTN